MQDIFFLSSLYSFVTEAFLHSLPFVDVYLVFSWQQWMD